MTRILASRYQRRFGPLLVILSLLLSVAPTLCLAALTRSQRQLEFGQALRELMVSATPTLNATEVDSAIERYLNSKRHKAIAVQDVYRRYFVSEGHEDSISAADRTLEGCQLRVGKACALVAVDDSVFSDVLVFKDMPRLTYAGDFDLSKIPVIPASTRARKDLQTYFTAPEPKAIAIHPFGTLITSSGEQSLIAAQAEALRKCNNDTVRGESGGPCFVYAISKAVVLPERLRVPR